MLKGIASFLRRVAAFIESESFEGDVKEPEVVARTEVTLSDRGSLKRVKGGDSEKEYYPRHYGRPPDGRVRIEKKSDGLLYLNGRKVRLFRSREQLRYDLIDGRELPGLIKSESLAPNGLLDFLLGNPEFFPEDWKGSKEHGDLFVCFLSTVYVEECGRQWIRGVSWSNGKVQESYDALGPGYGYCRPVAVIV